MKLGARTNPRNPLLDEIAGIGEDNFDFVDLVLEAPHAALERTEWKAVKSALADRGLGAVCQAAAYLPVDSPSPPVRQAALNELRRSVDAAQIVGAGLLIVPHYGWPAWFDDDAGYDFYEQLYGVLLKHGDERSIKIALENSERNQHQLKHFRQIFHRQSELRLAYNAGNGNVQTNASHTTRDYLFALRERLAHVRLSDNDGSAPQHLPFGAPSKGGINLRREVQTVRDFGYGGWITVDVAGERRLRKACAQWLRETWAAAAGG